MYFVTDGQKHDYLSRASQHARGATKNVVSQYLSTEWDTLWSLHIAYVQRIGNKSSSVKSAIESLCLATPAVAEF